jgi:Fe-S-cluster-containing dehydrogenase component
MAAGSILVAGVPCHTPTTAYAAETAATTATSEDGEQVKVFDGMKLAIGRVVHDPAICSGCRTCEIVCSAYNYGVGSPSLSRIQWDKRIMDACITDIQTCKQCAGPECVAVCPNGALSIDDETGARKIDETLCVGCQLCLNACPVVPKRIRYNAAKNVCFKCDLCDGDPQCVKFCPTGALTSSWVEVEQVEEEVDIFEINVTGDAEPFTHILSTQLSEAADGVHASGVVLTSHASQFNIILVNFTVTADFYDLAGNLVGSTLEPAIVAIPEMASGGFDLVCPTGNRATDIGKVVINCNGICITNTPAVS